MKTPNEDSIGGTISLPVASITPDPKNRKDHDGDKLKNLRDSIQAEGLMEPILVRETTKGNYKIIAGERRYRAVQLLKQSSITCRIVAGETDVGAARKRLVENMQREDLTAIEEARGYRELAVDHKMTQAAIAQIAGVGQPTVANSLRLLELPGEVQQLVQDGKLTRAHGVALARWAKWPKICLCLALNAVDGRLSSKDLETKGLPCAHELVRAKLVEEIQCYGYPFAKHDLSPAMQKDPDFVKADYGSTWYCLVPTKWIPERDRQEKAYEKRYADWKKKQGRDRSEPSKPSGAAMKKKVESNRKARAAIATSKEAAIKKLGETKGFLPAALIAICESALSEYKTQRQLKEAAKQIGVTLPKGTPGNRHDFGKCHFRFLHSLDPVRLVKLTAVAVLLRESEEAHKWVRKVPELVQIVSGAKGGAK